MGGFDVDLRRLASRGRPVVGLLAAVAATVALVGGAAAQQTPSSNTGPQFGEWGPGRATPGGEAQLPAPTGGNLGAAAPGAPAPSPSFGGCNFNLVQDQATSSGITR